MQLISLQSFILIQNSFKTKVFFRNFVGINEPPEEILEQMGPLV